MLSVIVSLTWKNSEKNIQTLEVDRDGQNMIPKENLKTQRLLEIM